MGALVVGVVLALCLFWSVGAHNRLVRLRSEVVRQWSSVDAVWLRLLVRLQGGLAARQSLVSEDEALELQALQNASDQMLEALTQARMQPLDEVVQKQVISQHLLLVSEIRLLQQQANEAIRPDLDIALNRMRQTLPAPKTRMEEFISTASCSSTRELVYPLSFRFLLTRSQSRA